ncbi:MAG: hypothetical protein ACE361_26210 [Aureliella sp.]
MVHRTSKQAKFTDRDLEILDHLMRYRLTTREILQRLFFEDSDISAVSKVTTRLIDRGALNKGDLDGERVYYTIGSYGAEIFGLNRNKAKLLGPQARVDNYAILQFCCGGEITRQRLLVRELRPIFGGKIPPKKLRPAMYYLDDEGAQKRLACIRVEQGSEPDHIVRRARDFLERAVTNPVLDRLVREHQFMITILTTYPQKKLQIEEAILRHSWPITFRVEAIDGLAEVAALGRRARTQREVL